MKYPKITVVTPSYNQGEYIEETILSVINQDYSNLEYIIIDGGSTDKSIDIIKSYSDRISYWQSKPDKGQSNAINGGFKKGTGDILCWLNSDDTFLPGSLNHVAKIYCSNNFDFYYSDINIIDKFGKKIKRVRSKKTNYLAQIYGHFAIPQQSSFWTSNIFKLAGPLNENNMTSMDGEYFIKILKLKDINIFQDNFPIANFRIHPDSLTGSGINEEQYLKDRQNLIGKYTDHYSLFFHLYYKYFYKFIA